MPKVGTKVFPYTAAGKAAAAKYRKDKAERAAKSREDEARKTAEWRKGKAEKIAKWRKSEVKKTAKYREDEARERAKHREERRAQPGQTAADVAKREQAYKDIDKHRKELNERVDQYEKEQHADAVQLRKEDDAGAAKYRKERDERAAKARVSPAIKKMRLKTAKKGITTWNPPSFRGVPTKKMRDGGRVENGHDVTDARGSGAARTQRFKKNG